MIDDPDDDERVADKGENGAEGGGKNKVADAHGNQNWTCLPSTGLSRYRSDGCVIETKQNLLEIGYAVSPEKHPGWSHSDAFIKEFMSSQRRWQG